MESASSALNLNEYLGGGQYGLVFKNSHVTCVKIIFSDPFLQKYCLRESSLEHLCHLNIVSLQKSWETTFTAGQLEELGQIVTDPTALMMLGGKMFLARRSPIPGLCIQMELCGETLRHWLNYHTSKTPEVLIVQKEIVIGLINGLRYLHDNKIMHRDFKPENIMFAGIGYVLPVKIGDFGLSRTMHSDKTMTTGLTSRMGTEDYMAPEVYTREYELSGDIFSLGLVMWEVAELIHREKKVASFHALVYDGRYDRIKPHALLPTIQDTIDLATKKDRRNRFYSMKELQTFFETVDPEEINKIKGEILNRDGSFYYKIDWAPSSAHNKFQEYIKQDSVHLDSDLEIDDVLFFTIPPFPPFDKETKWMLRYCFKEDNVAKAFLVHLDLYRDQVESDTTLFDGDIHVSLSMLEGTKLLPRQWLGEYPHENVLEVEGRHLERIIKNDKTVSLGWRMVFPSYEMKERKNRVEADNSTPFVRVIMDIKFVYDVSPHVSAINKR